MMKKRINKVEMYMEIAEVVSKRSTCLRKRVGAIIVMDGRIISSGYNGYPSGLKNCIDLDKCPEGPGCSNVVHAEANAILFAAKYGLSVEGATMYCNLSPCVQCAKMIINSGIKELIYSEDYRDRSGIDLLVKCGVEVCQVETTKRPESGEKKFTINEVCDKLREFYHGNKGPASGSDSKKKELSPGERAELYRSKEEELYRKEVARVKRREEGI